MPTPPPHTNRALELSPLALVGGALAIVSAFLAWDDMAGVAYDNAFKIPLRFLWQIDQTGGFDLGLPLVIVAAVVALFSISPLTPVVFLRRLGGVVLLGAVALFVVQLGRRSGWDTLDVGLGPWLAGAGGILLLLAPAGLWPFERYRTEFMPAPAAAAASRRLHPTRPPAMPAGWYTDPDGASQGYWDGENWTEHRGG